ncbi:hypothetical protein HYFRA_00001393 [Hymenoscyphus fraxineus]|uniref:Uncharacterized protein n=1 Tax=Hymenoscyphus fraxineus TaxID=746836 RepID=A0A9N9PMD1_9HELO|nr:hypothetical protein HYFRA_00001393 [Hymenoscyphus fraxineus]
MISGMSLNKEKAPDFAGRVIFITGGKMTSTDIPLPTISVHPGIVKTNLMGNLEFFDKPFFYLANFCQLVDTAQGAHNTLWAATSGRSKIRIDWSDVMYDPVGKLTKKLNVAVQDVGLATRL